MHPGSELCRLLAGLERQLHDPAVRRNPALVSALLADEFQEFGRSGRVYDKAAILDLLASEPDPSEPLEATGFALTPVGRDVALLSYRSVRGARATLRSSLWVFRAQRWLLLFHQGTPTPCEDSIVRPQSRDG